MGRMETRLEQTAPVREFAAAIGEWLLARRFGSITPLAFRWQVMPYQDDEIRPCLLIELLVNDPPPPPPEWYRLRDTKLKDMSRAEIRKWAQGGLWPREDRRALDEGALERARALGVPDALDDAWPVSVMLRGRTEAEELGMRFPHVAASAPQPAPAP